MGTKQYEGLEVTYLAVREALMTYFKGDCVDRVTDGRGVKIAPISVRTRHRHEQWEQALKNPSRLSLQSVPLMDLQAEPSKAIFHEVTLTRSPQMSELYKELKQFFKTYLPSVETEVNHDAITN